MQNQVLKKRINFYWFFRIYLNKIKKKNSEQTKTFTNIFNNFRPKNGTKESLEEYRKAVKIGEEQGDCWSFYPDCPVSIFNIIPDVYTTEDTIEVTFDGFDSGTNFSPNNTGDINDEIFNMIKDEMKVSKHNVDIDFTT